MFVVKFYSDPENSLLLLSAVHLQVVAQVIKRMYDSGIDPTTIGIITPYSGQESYLVANLEHLCSGVDVDYIDSILISSVDSFQGKEKDFIIFTTVRANKERDSGFLSNTGSERRLNVSITRAKYGMIIIGNADTFSAEPNWVDLMNSYVGNGCFVEGTIEKLVPSTFTPHLPKVLEKDEETEFEENLNLIKEAREAPLEL